MKKKGKRNRCKGIENKREKEGREDFDEWTGKGKRVKRNKEIKDK